MSMYVQQLILIWRNAASLSLIPSSVTVGSNANDDISQCAFINVRALFQLAVMFYWRKSRTLFTERVCVYRGLHFTVPNCINNPATSHSQRHNHGIFGTSHMKTQVLIVLLDVFFPSTEFAREKQSRDWNVTLVACSCWQNIVAKVVLLWS